MIYNADKIINIIDNKNINIINDDIDFKNIKILENIKEIIDNLYKNKIKFKKINTINLLRLHDSKGYPMIYLLYNRLYKLNLLSKIIKFVPDINNFAVFVNWYNIHHILISKDDITNIVNKSEDKELHQYYNIIFGDLVDEPRKEIHKILYDNPFVSLDIHQCYETNSIIYEKIMGDDLEIHLYKLNDDKTDYISKVIKVISMMREISKRYNGFSGKLNLTLFMSDRKKYLPKIKNSYICPININSGSSCPKVDVCVWRKEELIKVLIHELIHFHSFDFNKYDRNYDSLSLLLDKYIKIEGIDSANESYTETLATIIYLQYYSKLLDINFRELFKLELKFLYYQICKITNFFNKNNIFEIIIRQTTSVRSYYFIKFINLVNIIKFLKFIENNGLIIKDKIKEYTIYLERILESKNYIFNFYKKIDINVNEYEIQNMRMTLLDY